MERERDRESRSIQDFFTTVWNHTTHPRFSDRISRIDKPAPCSTWSALQHGMYIAFLISIPIFMYSQIAMNRTLDAPNLMVNYEYFDKQTNSLHNITSTFIYFYFTITWIKFSSILSHYIRFYGAFVGLLFCVGGIFSYSLIALHSLHNEIAAQNTYIYIITIPIMLTFIQYCANLVLKIFIPTFFNWLGITLQGFALLLCMVTPVFFALAFPSYFSESQGLHIENIILWAFLLCLFLFADIWSLIKFRKYGKQAALFAYSEWKRKSDKNYMISHLLAQCWEIAKRLAAKFI